MVPVIFSAVLITCCRALPVLGRARAMPVRIIFRVCSKFNFDLFFTRAFFTVCFTGAAIFSRLSVYYMRYRSYLSLCLIYLHLAAIEMIILARWTFGTVLGLLKRSSLRFTLLHWVKLTDSKTGPKGNLLGPSDTLTSRLFGLHPGQVLGTLCRTNPEPTRDNTGWDKRYW